MNKTGLSATGIGVASGGAAGYYALQMLGGSYPVNSETLTHAIALATASVGSLGVAGGIYWCEVTCLAILWVLAGDNKSKRDKITEIAGMEDGKSQDNNQTAPLPVPPVAK